MTNTDAQAGADSDHPTTPAGWGGEDPAITPAPVGRAVREAKPEADRPVPTPLAGRIAAVLMDAALLLLATLALGFVTAWVMDTFGLSRRAEWLPTEFLALLVCYTLSEVIGSATPGKWYLHLRVGRGDGRPAPPGLRACRWVVRNSPLLLLCLPVAVVEAANSLGLGRYPPVVDTIRHLSVVLLGAAAVTFVLLVGGMLLTLTGERRALHDRLTGTAVFRATHLVTRPGGAFRPVMHANQKTSKAPGEQAGAGEW